MPDNADLGRLIVRFDADLTRLEAKMSQAVRSTQRTAQQMEQSVSGVNLQRGLGNIISSGQSRILGEATSRLGLFGSALEALGPAALAAGAAIGVFAAATSLALNTAQWAEALGDTANQLALTTTQVQQLQFAATAAGIPVEQMTSSLVSLTQALGSAMGNDRMSGRFQRVFAELGIDREALQRTRDVSELLPLLADGFQRLEQASPARAAAIGARLGIDPEVLHELEQGRAHIVGLTGELERYGGVVSEEGVQKSAELADQMRILHGASEAMSRRLGSDLAPAFLSVANSALQAVGAIASLLEWMAHFDARSHQAQDAFNQAVAARARVAAYETGSYADAVAAGMPAVGGARVRANAAATARADALNAVIRGAQIQIAGINAAASAAAGPPPKRRPTLNSSPSARAARSRPGAARSSAKAGPEIISAAPGSLVDGRDMRGFALPVDQSVTLITPDTYLQPLFEAEDRMRETYHNVIQGGLEAAIHGGWPGLAKYIAEQLQQQMVQRLADTLTNMFVNAVQAANGQISLSGGGGGGLVGTLFQLGALAISGGRAGASTVGSASHVHAHAFGTDFAPGGLTKVGEYGMEYVNLPRGSQVLNARASKALSRMGGLPAGGMMAMLHQTIHLHAEGAVLGNELMATLDARAVQYAGAAFNGARRVVPMDMGRRALRKL